MLTKVGAMHDALKVVVYNHRSIVCGVEVVEGRGGGGVGGGGVGMEYQAKH